MSNVSVTPLSLEAIRALAEKDGSLWVINYTDHGMQRNRGNMHVSFTDENGENHGIVFPNTWIPIDASTFASVKQLIKSQTFLGAIRTSDLIVISDDEAKKMLNLPNAKDESANVAKKYANIAGVVRASTAGGTVNIFSGDTNAAPAMSENESAFSDESVSDPRLNEIVDMFTTQRLGDSDSADALKAISPRPSENALMLALSRITVTNSETYRTIAGILSGESVTGSENGE